MTMTSPSEYVQVRKLRKAVLPIDVEEFEELDLSGRVLADIGYINNELCKLRKRLDKEYPHGK